MLLKKTKFEWAEAQENTFKPLKSKLMKQIILLFPDFSEVLF